MFNYVTLFKKLNLKVLSPKHKLKDTKMNALSFQLFLYRVNPELLGIEWKYFKDQTIADLLDYVTADL